MKFFLGFVLGIFLFSCSGNKAQNKRENLNPETNTTIEFLEESYNLGKMKAGEIAAYTFEFTNTGKSNFKLSRVDCSCGCVAARYIEEAVKPGEKGWIEVEFDSSGLAGREYKSIDVHGNIDTLKHLAIFAEVENELLDIKY